MSQLTPCTFPPGFLWGAAIGAHRSERGNIAGDWWYSENPPDSRFTERRGGVIDSRHRWTEDQDLAAGAGFTDYRFGIEWSRIEPVDGYISRAAVDHYVRVIEGAVARGLRPMASLVHVSLPLWFSASGGWRRPDVIKRFLGYVDAVGPILDAGVERVMTIDEPNVVAGLPRLRKVVEDLPYYIPVPDPGLTHVMIGVHRAAVARVRTRHPGTAVGWGVAVQDYLEDPGGAGGLATYVEPHDQVFLRASAGDDFVGVQTCTGDRIATGGETVPDPDAARTLTAGEFMPRGLGGAVSRVARSIPGVPIIVTENGVGVSDDARRIDYTTRALLSLRETIDAGADVRGYFHWSLHDDWECRRWSPTFGLIAVDRMTFARTPKPSLAWLGGLAPAAGHAREVA